MPSSWGRRQDLFSICTSKHHFVWNYRYNSTRNWQNNQLFTDIPAQHNNQVFGLNSSNQQLSKHNLWKMWSVLQALVTHERGYKGGGTRLPAFSQIQSSNAPQDMKSPRCMWALLLIAIKQNKALIMRTSICRSIRKILKWDRESLLHPGILPVWFKSQTRSTDRLRNLQNWFKYYTWFRCVRKKGDYYPPPHTHTNKVRKHSSLMDPLISPVHP